MWPKRMTWGEFKKAVENRGVKDDYEISWIDFDTAHYGAEDVSVEIDEGIVSIH